MDQAYWGVLGLAAVLAFAESAIGLGVLLPGEAAIVAVAATATPGQVVPVIAAVALGAVAGDNVGFFLGRRLGPRLQESRLGRRVGRPRWESASGLMQRHGTAAVLASRLLPFVRTVMPAVAGAGGLRLRSFLVASVTGAVLWATLWVAAGSTLAAVGAVSLPILAAALGCAAVGVVAYRTCHRRAVRP